jgi:hypothetical protein
MISFFGLGKIFDYLCALTLRGSIPDDLPGISVVNFFSGLIRNGVQQSNHPCKRDHNSDGEAGKRQNWSCVKPTVQPEAATRPTGDAQRDSPTYTHQPP